jgi:hypothetical protein
MLKLKNNSSAMNRIDCRSIVFNYSTLQVTCLFCLIFTGLRIVHLGAFHKGQKLVFARQNSITEKVEELQWSYFTISL